MEGISNKTIVNFISKSKCGDVKKNFVGVFSSNCINKFIVFHSMLMHSGSKYPFIIINTDRTNKKVHIGGVS